MTQVYCCVIAARARKETNPSYELTSPSRVSVLALIAAWLICMPSLHWESNSAQ